MKDARIQFRKVIMPQLQKTLNCHSLMQVPRLSKIVINMGVGDGANNSKYIEGALKDLNIITGQKPVICYAKKSIAGFKIREGSPIGCKVTLRGRAMYNFCDKFINIALPRTRDFRGVNPRGFDGFGNYSLGVREQLIFPEIDLDQVVKVRGMDLIFVTTAKDNKSAYALLQGLGMPFSDTTKTMSSAPEGK